MTLFSHECERCGLPIKRNFHHPYSHWDDGKYVCCRDQIAQAVKDTEWHRPRLTPTDEELAELMELCLETYCNWCGYLADGNPCSDCLELYEAARAVVS